MKNPSLLQATKWNKAIKEASKVIKSSMCYVRFSIIICSSESEMSTNCYVTWKAKTKWHQTQAELKFHFQICKVLLKWSLYHFFSLTITRQVCWGLSQCILLWEMKMSWCMICMTIREWVNVWPSEAHR